LGLLTLLDGKFFEPLSEPLGALQAGQVIWLPVPQLDQTPFVIEATRSHSTSHSTVQVRWVPLKDEHFTRQRSEKDLPILNFRLGETEELIASKAKRRPGVVVGTRATLTRGSNSILPHHVEDRVVVAPIYGVACELDPKGFSSVMSVRIRHLIYNQFFPFAAWRETRSRRDCSNPFFSDGGVVRFDRLQFVVPGTAACRPAALRLSSEAMALMHGMLWAYLHAEQTPKLTEFRDVFRTLIPPEAAMPMASQLAPSKRAP